MRFSDVFAASLVAPLVTAHGGDIHGAPRIFGMPKHLKARNPWAGHQNVGHAAGPQLQARQGGNAENRCGTQGGGASCAAGFCCSAEGYCGDTKDHCAAPDCQIDFGPGCDANKTPYGATTKDDARPQLGNIAYGGAGIRSCLKPKTVAITYDDGPYIYTEQVMAQFEQRGGKATFFITGNNIGKGSIDENWSGVIQKMYANGHQIASHTWSHQNLDQITSAQRYDQMIKNEMAIRNIIGKYPTYMRPPYSACVTGPCMDDMTKLGYVITSFDLDTDDYNQLTKEKIQVAKDNFKKGIDSARPNGDQLAIAHDIHELTALNLTGYMLDYLYSNGFTAVTVGECMNDPEKNWYRDSTPGVRPSATPSSSAPVPSPTGPTSTDGQCGSGTAGKGQSCIGFVGLDGLSECCSSAGWCGRSSDHCGTGCNPLFGKCGAQPSLSTSAPVSVSKTSAAPSPTISLPTSVDGDCGAAAGKTCKGFLVDGVKAECCSQYNYCGSTEDYCGATCNPFYGNCGSSGSSSSVSASASQSASVSHSASVSASASVSSSASVSVSASASASASVSKTSSAAASSASSSKSDASVSDPASSTIAQSSSVSASASKSDVKSASSTLVPSSSASASASASKHESSSIPASKTSSASVHVSTDQSATPSASVSKHDLTSVGYPTTTPDVQSTKTPSPSASKTVSSDNVYPSHGSSAGYPDQSSTKVFPSTLSTLVKPSSTPCDDDTTTPTPTPTGPPVSKDGKCGKDNGGQTCAGYKDPFGNKVECCCLDSGRCSSAKSGCDTKYSNNNKY